VNNDGERGIALVFVMTATALLTALVGSLTLVVITDTAVATNHREAVAALYAAEAAVEFALAELAAADDWSDLLDGGRSAFINGMPDGPRVVGADAILHGSGRLRDLVPGSGADPSLSVAIWIADRSAEPKDEGASVERLSVVGEAFGARGTRRAVEAIVEKADTSAVRLLAWRELP
jgi:hypothetical protein